ncbi:hypothetical protein [Legionella quateirensis]|uniref:Uncharacterized protein n=1 Tax=Legionella quateirensis TaxID=45072 RepID=A0A378KZI0_9GAMM|nr:hypothetical protein [Legionella quateirensis]KTD46293.1 hypothetical protein Lqua_2396 [Legionella quateirensis]STY18937.1 Uncharacterised protein [Legionella quateirensis]
MSPYFFIFNFGFTVNSLAPKLITLGYKVIGTSRTPAEQQENNLDIKLIDFASTGTQIWRNDCATE